MTKRRELLIIVVLVVALLGTIAVGRALAANTYPEGPVGGGGGGGLAVSSSPLAMSATIFGPMHLRPEMNIPGWWNWIGGWLLGKALDPLADCITGPTGQCTTSNGPVGGGGGGGIPGECDSSACNGGGGGWARKAMSWNFFSSDFFTKKKE